MHSGEEACTFYRSCMDIDYIEKNGVDSLMSFLKKIGNWPVLQNHWDPFTYDMGHSIAQIQLQTGYGYIVSLMIHADTRNTSQNILSIEQPLLTIPESILSDKESNASKTELFNYRKFFFKIVQLFGSVKNESHLNSEFQSIVDFEIMLYKNMDYAKKEFVKQRKASVKMTVKELCEEIPEFDWLMYLQRVTNSTLIQLGEKSIIGLKDQIWVSDMDYIKKVSQILSDKQFSRQVANYLGWRVVTSSVFAHLPEKFYNALENYIRDSGYDPVVHQRWVICTTATINSFSGVLSFMYIQEYFPEEVKNEVMKLVYDIHFQFEMTLKRNLWMDISTKLSALYKLNAMKINIGHPDWLFSQQAVEENYKKKNMPKMANNSFENHLALSEHETRQQILKLRRRNTNDIWMMLPITVNAGYNENMNGITFPAVFLQSPLYEPDAPEFYNYAAIGSVIGHEMTHGFDNEGRKRNARGNLQNWWSSESEANFFNKSECFVKQYNSYGVNGVKTLAENIADNGGLRQSYKAFSQWIKNRKTVQGLPGLENFSIEQQFFLSYGSIWCTKYKGKGWSYFPAYDVHSPEPVRLRGTVANLPEFQEAFGCSEKSSLKKQIDQCKIW